MAEKEGHIPAWDGRAQTWRRYTKEVVWYVRSTPTHKRQYCATRLLSRLTGPARLLAMSWVDLNLDHPDGVRELLQRLAASPLVRQSLPNAAAICQQYFQFHRKPSESIQSFLVREALGYTEFVEALVRLYEDKHGVRQEDKDYGLPKADELEEWNEWEEGNTDSPHSSRRRSARAAHASEYGDAPWPDEEDPLQPESGSPWHASTVPSRQSVGVQPSTSGPPELSWTDSFVLGVLRGFRLLQSSGLTPEDKRDIISTTRGSLEFDVVARALQTLWDEQFLGRQNNTYQNHMLEEHDALVAENGDWSWALHGDSWESGGWEDWSDPHSQYYAADWTDYDWEDAHVQEASAEDTEALKEAQQAEKVAESLAAEAQRTWSEAQRATAALRRDRGFGHVVGAPGKGGKGPCFICGGPHYSKVCPDRRHPSYSKGYKGKNSFYQYDYNPEELYFVGKGKGKQKGKHSTFFASKGKKGKGKSSSSMMTRPPVNAYAADEVFMGALEIAEAHRAETATPLEAMGAHQGLLDCGATASAGPQVAVESLMKAILSKDHQAQIEIQKDERPYFRFGNGRWGQALYRVHVCSRASGEPRIFQLYALPNPPDLHDPNFDRSTLVPILVGMSHLAGSCSSMAVDFRTGMAMDTFKNEPEAYRLPSNRKGHYILDIVNYLTGGREILEGHAAIRVTSSRTSSQADLHVLEFHPLEHYDGFVQQPVEISEVDLQHSLHCLQRLHEHSRQLSNASAVFQTSMRSSVILEPNSPPAGNHVGKGHSLRSRGGGHQGIDAQEEGDSSPRPRPLLQDGHKGSSCQQHSVAVLRQTCSGHHEVQPSRSMDQLRSLPCPPGVHPSCGLSGTTHQARQSGHGQAHAQGALRPDGRRITDRGHLSCDASQDRRGGGLAQAGGRCQEVTTEDTSVDGLQDTSAGPDPLHESATKLPGSLLEHGSCGDGHSVTEFRGFGTSHRSRHGEAADRGREDSSCRPSTRSKGRRNVKWGSHESQPVRSSVREEKTAPLTHHLGAKVMMMVMTLTSTMTAAAMDLCVDGRDGLWEVACAPHSWLSEASMQHGIPSRRINLAEGYDLYQEETWHLLSQLHRKHRPRKIWLSLPCTKFCKWTFLNYSTPERKLLLRSHQRRERKMLWNMNQFLKKAMDADPSMHVYFEWTHPCQGWSEAPMIDLERYFHENDLFWQGCRVDGCVYGMRNLKDTDFIKKSWKIMTTDEYFWKIYRAKTCGGGHSHSWIQGAETARSAYYPWKLCQAIARTWRQQFLSDKNVNYLFRNYDKPTTVQDLLAAEEEALQPELPQEDDLLPRVPDYADGIIPSNAERQQWQAKVARFHKAAGHPTNANLARIVKEANQPQWKIDLVKNFSCPACEALRPGGQSSKMVPPASTHALPKAWQVVGMDTSEWQVPNQKVKLKFLLMVNLATKLRVVHVIKEYSSLTMDGESAEDVIHGLTEKWLAHFPKPELIVCDNGMGFTADKFNKFMQDLNIYMHFPPEKEPWAHGIVEAAIQDVKHTASAIQLDDSTLSPRMTLVLATAALNNTEYTAGYTANQWACGKMFNMSDEDTRTFQNADPSHEFAKLIQQRQAAEEVATRTRAKRVLSKLSNTIVRQPLRNFNPMDMVMVWRRLQPTLIHKGVRGGLKKAAKPRWIGPGRVVFQELLPHQEEGDHRRHILWVLVGSKMLRCSVHSVRPVTETERFTYEITTDEDPSQWKSLADILPKREYVDIVDEVPNEEDRELPDLPDEPDNTTYVPIPRAKHKQTFGPDEYVKVHRSSPLGLDSSSSANPKVKHWIPPPPAPDLEYTPSVAPEPGEHEDDLPEAEVGADTTEVSVREKREVNDYDREVERPPKKSKDEESHKKARSSYDLGWIDLLRADVDNEAQDFELYQAFQETEEFLCFELDISFDSNRQRKQFLHNPVSYLVKKLNSSEVKLERLSAADRELFHRAKLKEVNSFLKNAAVRACLNDQETREAYTSGRILKARWVLTWKPIPPDELQEAKRERALHPDATVLNESATAKAKARVVLLGYQHPSLLDRGFKTAAPVQSLVGRHLLYVLSVWHQWELQGLDLATAFLQTQPTESDAKIWTSGVEELKTALNVPQDTLLRILRNVYGSTTAPRGLWLSLHNKLTELRAVAAVGERCLWLWFSKTELDSTGQFPRLLGAMGGHVDDFHRVGDVNSSEWQAICQRIDAAYQWGSVKRGCYRHAGTDITSVRKPDGLVEIEVDQDSYIETLQFAMVGHTNPTATLRSMQPPAERFGDQWSVGARQGDSEHDH